MSTIRVGQFLPVPAEVCAILPDDAAFISLDHGGTGPRGAGLIINEKKTGLTVWSSEHFSVNTPPETAVATLAKPLGDNILGIGYDIAARVVANKCRQGLKTPAIDGDYLGSHFGCDCTLLNDFEAPPYWLHWQPPAGSQTRRLQRGSNILDSDNLAVVGSGSGVGLSGRIRGQGHASEGSHVPAAAISETGSRYLDYLRGEGKPTLYEHVVRSHGITDFFRFFWKQMGRKLPNELKYMMEDGPIPVGSLERHIFVTKTALSGYAAHAHVSEVALQAAALYMEFYATLCQTAAMFYTAGRVYLAGGVMAHLVTHPNFKSRLLPPYLVAFNHHPEPVDRIWLGSRPVHALLDPHFAAVGDGALCALLRAAAKFR